MQIDRSLPFISFHIDLPKFIENISEKQVCGGQSESFCSHMPLSTILRDANHVSCLFDLFYCIKDFFSALQKEWNKLLSKQQWQGFVFSTLSDLTYWYWFKKYILCTLERQENKRWIIESKSIKRLKIAAILLYYILHILYNMHFVVGTLPFLFFSFFFSFDCPFSSIG